MCPDCTTKYCDDLKELIGLINSMQGMNPRHREFLFGFLRSKLAHMNEGIDAKMSALNDLQGALKRASVVASNTSGDVSEIKQKVRSEISPYVR